jgi:hypothetical protein
MGDSKLKRILEFFINCVMSPVTLMQMIKNKPIRWIFAIPLLFSSIIILAIFGMPILLLIIAVSTESLVNNDF